MTRSGIPENLFDETGCSVNLFNFCISIIPEFLKFSINVFSNIFIVLVKLQKYAVQRIKQESYPSQLYVLGDMEWLST